MTISQDSVNLKIPDYSGTFYAWTLLSNLIMKYTIGLFLKTLIDHQICKLCSSLTIGDSQRREYQKSKWLESGTV